MRFRFAVALGAAMVLLGATITPSAAALPRQVALQVQYPNGAVRVWCVPYRADMTGADVLAKARPTYGTGPYAGFVLQIGGKGTVPPSASHYWAYWRSTSGKANGYAYSSSGVTATKPPVHSVETWVWTTGTTTPVPKKSFAALCPGA